MAEMWYYTSEGKQMDPVSIKELKRMVSDGVLKPTDMVWKDGMPRWIRASSVNELYPDPTAALDQYFATGKDKRPTSPAAPAVAASGAAPAPAPADEEESRPRVKKRPTSGNAADDDDRDSKPSRQQSGGSSVGIVIALLLGGGLLVVALVVGVIILVVATRQGPNPNPQRLARPGNGGPAQPKENPENSFTKVVTKFDLELPTESKRSRDIDVRKGIEYQVAVRGEPQGEDGPDIDLHVFDARTNMKVAQDISFGQDSIAYFTAEYDGKYRVELWNVENGPPGRATVTIREPEIKKEEPKEPTLPADVMKASGVAPSINLPPGLDTVIKVRVKAGVKASFIVTTHPFKLAKARPEVNHLFILKETNDTVLASDTQPVGTAQASIVPTVTEVVRVRVVNTSKTTTRVSIHYDLGP